MVERDEEYWKEVERAVGTGTRSILLGTSTRSLRRNLQMLRGAVVSNPKTPDCGPHCKVKVSKFYGPLRTLKINHCRCRKCHGKRGN